ncbi:30S ribosomal protein S9 [bacterium]|nr:30S ribosomal protein S9 [bacterium]|tara:strand:+ start:1068 stop:1496 length:429 start_codon:yes stop_codon:yes gene_type:complete
MPITAEKKGTRRRRNYLYAVGRRKTAVARVRLTKKGEGEIIINEKSWQEYFPTLALQNTVTQPLKETSHLKDVNFSVKVQGGGKAGQADAVRHGIARTLVLLDKDLRNSLKPLGYLTRDARKKERKKPGLKRARRAPQWAKR